MKSKIIEILIDAHFDVKFIEYIKNEFPDTYTPLITHPYSYDFPDNPLLDLSPTERLFALLHELPSLKEEYRHKNIPNSVFTDSIHDLSYRINRYLATYGEYGLSERDALWLRFIYKFEIFDLGSLRFQKTHFSYAEIERTGYDFMPLSNEMKERFPEGEPIINVHIMRDADLSPKRIDKSFELARHFFATYFPDHKYTAFTCRTWMLYPPTQDLLPTHSNITSFANRFEIIAFNQNDKQALDRIYETSNLVDIAKMEKSSSLAEVAYKNLHKLGVATGVILK